MKKIKINCKSVKNSNTLLKQTCCICGETFIGYGNNPAPYVIEGRCCNFCNSKVIRYRLALIPVLEQRTTEPVKDIPFETYQEVFHCYEELNEESGPYEPESDELYDNFPSFLNQYLDGKDILSIDEYSSISFSKWRNEYYTYINKVQAMIAERTKK